MEELELTYLAKTLPANLERSPKKEMVDIYVPASAVHPVLRIRKNGEKFEITKKEPIDEADSSRQLEQTIPLTPAEYQALAGLPGKRVAKTRYNYIEAGANYEIDVFQEELRGLVLVDIEFDNLATKQAFKMPSFCLADVTQEEFVAGGMLCGKKLADIQNDLDRFNYQPLSV